MLYNFIKKIASLKVTVVLLAAFLLIIFWGILGQGLANDTIAGDRFFKNYFVWVLGVIPLPAFKSLAAVATLQIIISMIFKLKNAKKNVGILIMHFALVILAAGSILQSEIQKEYNGYKVVDEESKEIIFFDVNESNILTVKIPESSKITYKGRVENIFGKTVEVYSAIYNPLNFIPYLFMILFFLGAFINYLQVILKRKNSNLENLNIDNFNKNYQKKFALFIALFAVAFCGIIALKIYKSESPKCIYQNEKMIPADSYAREFLDDLNGKVYFKIDNKKLSAINLVNLIAKDSADNFEIFKILRGDLAEALGFDAKKRYLSFENLKRKKNLLELYGSRNDNHPGTLEANRLLHNLKFYESIKSEWKNLKNPNENLLLLKSEIVYHKMNFALVAFILVAISCGSAFINFSLKSKKLDFVANLFCGMSAVTICISLLLRTFITFRPPLSSLYEIILLVSLLLLAFEGFAYLFCKRRNHELVALITLIAAVLLFFVKFILEKGNTFESIPAVLNSSAFLTIHVFTIALGYGGMILSGVVAHLILFRISKNSNINALQSLLYGTLVFGGMFTLMGTVLGGVWADFAWGRFWGFDPKENGALFVVLWAMLLLHLKKFVPIKTFAILNGVNIIVTFLCWFGINLMGVGLHSYGFNDASVVALGGFLMVDFFVILVLSKLKNVNI